VMRLAEISRGETGDQPSSQVNADSMGTRRGYPPAKAVATGAY